MVNSITGVLKKQLAQSIILQVGPISLTICVPDSSAFNIEEIITIQTHLHWNQEQGPTLYGFTNSDDRTIFLLVTSCPGIGPKIGLATLAQLGSQVFIEAIQLQDERLLSKVSGIGARKAGQIIAQLRDKVTTLLASGLDIKTTESTKQWSMLTQALESLNYSRTEIAQAVSNLKSNFDSQNQTFDQLMRKALSFLSKQA